MRFTSYERDPESGNDYAMHRYHGSRLGRFSSADPVRGRISNPQLLNRYSYVRDDPINHRDPSGLFFVDLVAVDWLGGGWGGIVDPIGIAPDLSLGLGCDPTMDPACASLIPLTEPIGCTLCKAACNATRTVRLLLCGLVAYWGGYFANDPTMGANCARAAEADYSVCLLNCDRDYCGKEVPFPQ